MDDLKKLLFRNFELLLTLVILTSVALINYYVPYKLAFLNFYFLPILLSAYYFGVRRAYINAFLSFILVGIYFYLDPQSFRPGNTNVDLLLSLVTWGGFLILSAALVGGLNAKLQKEIQETTVLHQELSVSQTRAAETNKMLGLLFQGQGMLDIAFDKFRLCPVDESILELLYNLAADMERKREYAKAVAVYEHIAKSNPRYRDIQTKQKVLQQATRSATAGGPSSQQGVTLITEGVSKPMLGRYELDRELGRGDTASVQSL